MKPIRAHTPPEYYSPEEVRVWEYLLKHPLASAEDVALNMDVPVVVAQGCIDRIGTPREVFVAEAVTPSTEGRKDDAEKPRYDLIPPEILHGLAVVLTYGAVKYSERNWERGMRWGRPFGALMRHMWAWWRGEDKDPETGYSHLWHAACCVAFLISYEARKLGEDDRNKVN